MTTEAQKNAAALRRGDITIDQAADFIEQQAKKLEAAQAAWVDDLEVRDEMDRAKDKRIEELEAERDQLRAAIFGGSNYMPELGNGNFIEMVKATEQARKFAVERAVEAEAALKAAEQRGYEKAREQGRKEVASFSPLDGYTLLGLRKALSVVIRDMQPEAEG